MISSEASRKQAEPWFAINKSIYDGILDVALADVLTPPMTSSQTVPLSSNTTNCSELLKLLNDNEDVKPGDFAPKHPHVTAGTNEFTSINRGVSPVFDSASVTSSRPDHKNWNNLTGSDNTSAARGTGPRLEGADHHQSARIPRIHSPSRDCFSISRLTRPRAMLSRNRPSPAPLSNRPNTNRTHPKCKRNKTNHVNYFNQSLVSICPPLSAGEFEMNEIVRDLNPSSVKSSVCLFERFSESPYTECHRKAPLVVAASRITAHKEQKEKRKRCITRRQGGHPDERAKRNNASIIIEIAPMKGGSKAFSSMSVSQGIEDSNNRPIYTVKNSTDTKKDKAYNNQDGECYPLDLTISNLAEASAQVITKIPRELKELNSGRKPEIMSRFGKTTKEQTIVGKAHVDVPNDPAKVCWTKVEKDTLLKVVERLSITCLAEEDVDIERSPIVAATNNSNDFSGDSLHSNKVQTPLSVNPAMTTTTAQMPSPMNDIKSNLTKRISYEEADSEATPPIKIGKLLDDSFDGDSCDVSMTSSLSTSVNVVKAAQNNDSLCLSPSAKNIYEKCSLGASPVKDAKLVEVRTSRKRVHFNELQPCATSEEHSQGFHKRSNVPTKEDHSACSSSKLSRSAHEDSGRPEIHDSIYSENKDSSVYSENQDSAYLDIQNSAYSNNRILPFHVDNKDSIVETEQHNTLLSERKHFLSQCSDSALKTCHDIYLTTTRRDSTSENSYDNLSVTYENPREEADHGVSCQKLFGLESYPNTLRDHCLNAYKTEHNLEQDSGKDVPIQTTRYRTKRNNSNIHQHVVIRVDDTGSVSQQFWAAVDKTIVSNMVDQILTSAVNCNRDEQQYLFEHRDHHSYATESASASREMDYYRSAEAVWQHFHDFSDLHHVARSRKVSAKATRRDDEEEASNDADDVTCDVIEPGLGVTDAESAYESHGESGTAEGHSTFKWKSNILKRVRIDQIMTSPAPISDWRRSPNVASPVAV